MRAEIDRMTTSLQPLRLFSHLPTVGFAPETNQCRCGGEALVSKTKKRVVATMEIGTFCAYETILKCCRCARSLRSEKLRQLVPYRGKFGFNVLEYIGMELFVNCRGEREIQQQLKERNIPISRSEIGYLGKKFIAYLALVHRESRPNLKKLMTQRGGYVLHLDATCEGGSPHLFSALDEVAGLVLGNIKLPSEKAEHIVPFLRDLKKAFGAPLAIVRDMGRGIESAVNEVFPRVNNFICHFHFLRDIGKDLIGCEYDMLRKGFRSYAISASLRELAKRNKDKIIKSPELSDKLKSYTQTNKHGMPSEKLPATVIAYTLSIWILDSKQEATGYGFPFDRVHLSTYRRLIVVKEVIQCLKKRGSIDKELKQLDKVVSQVINDKTLKKVVPKLEDKVEVFDQLRAALRIATPKNTRSLNDDGDTTNIETMEQQVVQWKEQVEFRQRASSQLAYKRVLKQLDKHWSTLFAQPIIVTTRQGSISIQPQRTNNILERLFRDLKRSYRKRSGTHRLSKTIKTMFAEVPLVKNLSNQDYMETILDGKNSLAERFADIDAKLIQQYIAQQKDSPERIQPALAKIIRLEDFPKKIVQKHKYRAHA